MVFVLEFLLRFSLAPRKVAFLARSWLTLLALALPALRYVLASTVVVLFGGAAGMLAFENTGGHPGLDDYPSALWWTAMVLTTMGSGYWPRTGAGRTLCLLLALYGFGVFGYFTAYLASFFVGRGASGEERDRTR